jgi:nitrite reductase/ring-hydroxylating ferredoxin subunit
MARTIGADLAETAAPPAEGAARWEPVTLQRDGELRACAAAGVEVLVVGAGADLRAFGGRCPHQGVLLAEGALVDGELVCRGHGWRFDCRSGRRIGGERGLVPLGLRREGARLLVDVQPLLARDQPDLQAAPPTRALATAAPLEISKLPGPRGLPLLGNVLSINPKAYHHAF